MYSKNNIHCHDKMLVQRQTKQQRAKSYDVDSRNIKQLLPELLSTLSTNDILDLYVRKVEDNYSTSDIAIPLFDLLKADKIRHVSILQGVPIDDLKFTNVESIFIERYVCYNIFYHFFETIIRFKCTKQIKVGCIMNELYLNMWFQLFELIARDMANYYKIFVFDIHFYTVGEFTEKQKEDIENELLKIENYVERNKKGYEKCKNACIATLGIFKLYPGTIQKDVVLLIGNMIFNTGGTEVWVEK